MSTDSTRPRIAVIGIGGGGMNAMHGLVPHHLDGVSLIAANTDFSALDSSKAEHKVWLGSEKSIGVGSQSTFADPKQLPSLLDGVGVTFIVAGLGGETGSSMAPILAQQVKKTGSVTIGFVTIPFAFEGKKRVHPVKAYLAS